VWETDPIRTEVVKAVIVLREGFAAGEALKSDLQEYVARDSPRTSTRASSSS